MEIGVHSVGETWLDSDELGADTQYQDFAQSLVEMAANDANDDPTLPSTLSMHSASNFHSIPLQQLFNFDSGFWSSYSHLTAATYIQQEAEILETFEENIGDGGGGDSEDPAIDLDGFSSSVLWF